MQFAISPKRIELKPRTNNLFAKAWQFFSQKIFYLVSRDGEILVFSESKQAFRALSWESVASILSISHGYWERKIGYEPIARDTVTVMTFTQPQLRLLRFYAN